MPSYLNQISRHHPVTRPGCWSWHLVHLNKQFQSERPFIVHNVLVFGWIWMYTLFAVTVFQEISPNVVYFYISKGGQALCMSRELIDVIKEWTDKVEDCNLWCSVATLANWAMSLPYHPAGGSKTCLIYTVHNNALYSVIMQRY